MKIISCLFITLLLVNCSNKSEIYKLDLVFENREGIIEYFVINSPPVSQDSLVALVRRYNCSTFEGKGKPYETFTRVFLKETCNTNRYYYPTPYNKYWVRLNDMYDDLRFDDVERFKNHKENLIITSVLIMNNCKIALKHLFIILGLILINFTKPPV